MGKVNLSLSDEAEQKLRKLAEKHKRTLAGQVEYALEEVEK
jgi:predicted transcriptional regulator